MHAAGTPQILWFQDYPGVTLVPIGPLTNLALALALFAAAWLAEKWPGPLTTWTGYLFLVGVILFSGSLYLLSISGIKWLGMITPLGGVCFLAGWLCLAIGIWKS